MGEAVRLEDQEQDDDQADRHLAQIGDFVEPILSWEILYDIGRLFESIDSGLE
jgi:hypothetical protein